MNFEYNLNFELVKKLRDEILDLKKNDLFLQITVIFPYYPLINSFEKELARHKISLANVRFFTFPQFISECCRIPQYINGYKEISSVEKNNIINGIVKSGKMKYFENVRRFDSLSILFSNLISEIKLECSEQIIKKAFSQFNKKGEDILSVYEQYQKFLKKNNLIDYADQCDLFLKNSFDKQAKFILYPGISDDLSEKEIQCIDYFKKNAKVTELSIDLNKIQKSKRIIEFKSAPFESFEVKEIVRDIFNLSGENVPFEDIAVICPNETYISYFREYFALTRLPCYFDSADSPTMKNGFEILTALLNLISSDFNFQFLKRFLQLNKNLSFAEENGNKISGFTILKALRKYGVPAGFSVLCEKIRDCIANPKDYEIKEYEVSALKLFDSFLERISKFVESFKTQDTIKNYCDFICSLIETFINSNYEKTAMLNIVESIKIYNEKTVVDFEYFSENFVSKIKNFKISPSDRQGKVFITTDMNTGIFGYIFMCGLEDANYPRRFGQNPLLLDSEKILLNSNYNTKFKLTEFLNSKENKLFENIVNNAEQKWTGYYPSIDILSGKERFSSFYYIDLFEFTKKKSANITELTDFLNKIKIKYPLFPENSDKSIFDFEYDLSNLSDKKYKSYLFKTNLNIRRSYLSEWMKWDKVFNEYTGKIDTFDKNEKITSSATGLELFMKCHYAYFLKNYLKLKPVEEPVAAEEIDILTYGSLVHSILYEFKKAIKNRKINESDKKMLLKIMDNEINKMPNTFRIQLMFEKMKSDISVLLNDFFEYEISKDRKSIMLEYKFGWNADEKPVELKIGNYTFKLSGSIDRVDETDEEFIVLDYKTSKSSKFKNKIMDGGKQIQQFIYAELLYQIKKNKNKKISAGYLPLLKEENKGVDEIVNEYNSEIRKSLQEILSYIYKNINEGFFIPTGECEYCNFTDICGNDIYKLLQKKFERDNSETVLKLKEIRDNT